MFVLVNNLNKHSQRTYQKLYEHFCLLRTC